MFVILDLYICMTMLSLNRALISAKLSNTTGQKSIK